jgi:hypothetical protein
MKSKKNIPIPAIIILVAILAAVALYTSWRTTEMAQTTAGGQTASPYRELYDNLSIERDNLLQFVEHDHDLRAAEADGQSPHDDQMHAAWSGGNLGSGDVVAFVDHGSPRIITVTANDDSHKKTTYYLVDGKEPYLVVQERPVGEGTPYVDRWYFADGEYIAYSNSDPTLKPNTSRFSYSPTGEDDLARLKDQLAGALDALKLPHSSYWLQVRPQAS